MNKKADMSSEMEQDMKIMKAAKLHMKLEKTIILAMIKEKRFSTISLESGIEFFEEINKIQNTIAKAIAGDEECRAWVIQQLIIIKENSTARAIEGAEHSKVQASGPVPDERVEKEDKSGSLNEKRALESESSGAYDKGIKEEPGLVRDEKTSLSAKFREIVEPNKERYPAHVLQVIEQQLTILQQLDPRLSEFNVTRNYLDWLTSLPFGNYSDETFDVRRAARILNEDHYGLTPVKKRILEFIAVAKRRGTSQGKIICLVGPPGVDKTSIGRSIARALNRRFYRFSIEVADVAEIKGDNRNYIGAKPGKMVQCLKNVGTANPLVLIDEIDQLGRGHAVFVNALLELLNPKKNANFLDHYLGVPIDISKFLFVCTANVVEMVPNPLLRKMEVITIAMYNTDEKMHIARDLEKITRDACCIKPEEVEVTDAALLALIENYQPEPGVQYLQDNIEMIYRKAALELELQGALNEAPVDEDQVVGPNEAKEERISESSETVVGGESHVGAESVEGSSNEQAIETSVEAETVQMDLPANQVQCPTNQPTDSKGTIETDKIATKRVKKLLIDAVNLSDFVGKPFFPDKPIYATLPIGVVMGLAWTAMGGSTLYIETKLIEQGEGKSDLHLTGRLGEVMKESAQIAHTVARAILLDKEPDNPFFANSKVHLHVPAGATPKDGPSAGCTMITSLLSLAMKKPVKKDLAMTGEVTLTGRIISIGGVKEKTIAARRSDVKTIIFPEANRRDFDELAPNVKEGLDVHFVDDYNQIFKLAFGDDQETEK